jgi:hypothetical protein
VDTDVSVSPDAIEFFFLAEKGILERQALLLCGSIRMFGGVYRSAGITVVSPRSDRRPSPATLQAFERLGAEYLDLDLSSEWPSYGASFRGRDDGRSQNCTRQL